VIQAYRPKSDRQLHKHKKKRYFKKIIVPLIPEKVIVFEYALLCSKALIDSCNYLKQ